MAGQLPQPDIFQNAKSDQIYRLLASGMTDRFEKRNDPRALFVKVDEWIGVFYLLIPKN